MHRETPNLNKIKKCETKLNLLHFAEAARKARKGKTGEIKCNKYHQNVTARRRKK